MIYQILTLVTFSVKARADSIMISLRLLAICSNPQTSSRLSRVGLTLCGAKTYYCHAAVLCICPSCRIYAETLVNYVNIL